VQCGHRPLGRLPRAERAEVAGVVVAHLFDQRQARKRFDGDLQPVLPFRELRPPVVPRLVLRDQPQLADLGLERRTALDPAHPGGDTDHLADPGAGLGRGEVRPDPIAQVLRLADVQHLAAVVGEQVHTRCVRQRFGQMPLRSHGRRDPGRECLQVLQRLHAERPHPLEQSVQYVDCRTGVRQRAVVRRGGGPEQLGQCAEFAVRRLVGRDHPAGQQSGVDDGEIGPVVSMHLAVVFQEPHVERRVVRHHHTALRELQERRQHRADPG
jgi:hypothetical protein